MAVVTCVVGLQMSEESWGCDVFQVTALGNPFLLRAFGQNARPPRRARRVLRAYVPSSIDPPRCLMIPCEVFVRHRASRHSCF